MTPIKIKIKIKSFNNKQLKIKVNQIKSLLLKEIKKNNILKEKFNWYKPLFFIDKVNKGIDLPKKKTSVSFNKSPFIFKKSGETFTKIIFNTIVIIEIKQLEKLKKNCPKEFLDLLCLKMKYKKKEVTNTEISYKINKTVMVK